jgi:oxygen-dependent protoporphyrinogen oxidase
MAPRVIIVGGGITGLSAAYELSVLGVPAILLEPRPRLGGVIETETIQGCVIEGGPDSFLSAKPAAAALIRELGLGDGLTGSNDESRVTYVVRGGRLVALPEGLMMMAPTRLLPVALSPLLSWATKFRMGLEYFRRPPRAAPPDRTVAEFIRAHYGRETVDYLAEPLLAGVYGGSADRLSADSVLPRFVELEAKYGSLTRGVMRARARAGGGGSAPLFQTLKNGLAQLTAELERRIRGPVEVAQASAEAVEAAPAGWRVRSNGEWIGAPGVLFACPAWAAGELLRTVHAPLAEALESIEYTSSLTLALGYRRQDCGPIPPGFGFLVPACERKKLVACTFVGAKFAHRVPETYAVMRCFLGGAGQDAVLGLSDEEIARAASAELRQLLGWAARPAFTRIWRWPRSMAQYTVGHGAKLSRIQAMLTGLPGLALAGNAYDGIGISDCVRTGRQAARTLAARGTMLEI